MAKILFFGRLSDVSGPMEVNFPQDVATTEQLKTWLGEQDSTLAEALFAVGIFVSVNKVIVQEDTAISNTDEIAFMSALSGG